MKLSGKTLSTRRMYGTLVAKDILNFVQDKLDTGELRDSDYGAIMTNVDIQLKEVKKHIHWMILQEVRSREGLLGLPKSLLHKKLIKHFYRMTAKGDDKDTTFKDWCKKYLPFTVRKDNLSQSK